MPQPGLDGWAVSAQQGALIDGERVTDDKGDDEAGGLKAQKAVAIKEINFGAVVVENEITAKTADLKQKAR